MSLFLKDPKTCINPWHGLTIIVFVCSIVMVTLFIGKKRFESSLGQAKTSGGITSSNNRFKF